MTGPEKGGASAPPASIDEARRRKLAKNLEKAQRARRAKAALREAIKSRDVDDLEVLRGDSRYENLVCGWPVERLLLIMRRIGRDRATDVLDFARVRPTTKLGTLSYAKREELVRLVAEARQEVAP